MIISGNINPILNVSDHFLLKKKYKLKLTWIEPDGSYWKNVNTYFQGLVMSVKN